MNDWLVKQFAFLATFEWPTVTEEQFKREYRSSQRTVQVIMASGYFLACHEPASVLMWLANEAGIPGRLVQTHLLDWCVWIGDEFDFGGHCYVELFLDGQWQKIDPTQRELVASYPQYALTYQGEYDSFNEFVREESQSLKHFFSRLAAGFVEGWYEE